MSRRAHKLRALHPTAKPAAGGFTLVEIMVAVTIGLIVLAAVLQIFATSRATYGLEEDLARLQESGRFSMEFISQDVRMSGNLGCLKKFSTLGSTIINPVEKGNRLNNPNDYGWNFVPGQHLRGHAYTGSGSTANLNDWTDGLPPAYFAPDEVLPNTDVLVVRRALAQSFKLMAAAPQNGSVDIPDTNELQTNDIVLITDCNDGDIFQITGTSSTGGILRLSHATTGSPGNAFDDLSKPYGINSEVMQLVTRVYYVGPGVNERPTLFRKQIGDGTVATQPLVDDVEVMKVLYGEDTDTPSDKAANIYRTADDPAIDWTRIVSVRIGLLVRTPNRSGPDLDTNTYDLAGITVDPTPAPIPDDTYQRRVFTSTIQLRNPI